MKTIGIFYFSGTGNTELAANIIRDKFTELDCMVDLLRMEDIMKVGLHVDPDQYDYLGIGCPVIGFGVPRLAVKFIRDLPNAYGKKTFIFRTAGGVAPVNYNASKPIIGCLSRKGYEVEYERVFSISSNWMVKFDDTVVKQLFKATKEKAESMCLEVLDGDKRILKTGIGLRLLMGMVRTLSSGMLRFMGKDFVVDQTCSHCGICIRNCPMGNICEKAGNIRFGLSCSSCMRCIYSCPNHAIRFRILTFFPVKDGYNINETLSGTCEANTAEPLAADVTAGCIVPPFYYNYVRNDHL